MTLLWLVACRAPPVDAWQGCLADGAQLASDAHLGSVPVPGSNAVLGIGAHWGELPLVSDHGRTRSLWVELPPAATGTYDVAARPRRYSERSWTTDAVVGTVRVDVLTPHDATVSVDVVVQRPTAPLTLAGRLVVPRGTAAGCRP
ncbi:MAG: hypothetical protein R3F59_31025 [Myxococcota bacterium]